PGAGGRPADLPLHAAWQRDRAGPAGHGGLDQHAATAPRAQPAPRLRPALPASLAGAPRPHRRRHRRVRAALGPQAALSVELPLRRIERYVAIGDSSTEGLDDPRSAGGFRGWADRLAE